jgi:hypothetical protein
MKWPILKLLALWAAASLLVCAGARAAEKKSSGQTNAAAASVSPTPGAVNAAEASASPSKNGKNDKAASGKAPNPNKPASKDIPFPLPLNEVAKMVKIPQTGLAGELLSQLMATEIKRIDEENVQMQQTKIDFYQTDGQTDFHIDVPTSIFNLKTRIIRSNDPVTVRTQDFELTGEKMEFDTVERSGKLIGRVHMRIFNLKKMAGDKSDETP